MEGRAFTHRDTTARRERRRAWRSKDIDRADANNPCQRGYYCLHRSSPRGRRQRQQCEGWVAAGQRNNRRCAHSTTPTTPDGRNKRRFRAFVSTAAKGQHSCGAVQGRASCVATSTLSRPPLPHTPPPPPHRHALGSVDRPRGGPSIQRKASTGHARHPEWRCLVNGTFEAAPGTPRAGVAAQRQPARARSTGHPNHQFH